MNFTQIIYQRYLEMGIETKSHKSPVYYIEPIIKLTPEQKKRLQNGDGQSNPDEYKQINSSTGLAINYYKILESTGKIEKLWFEDKVEKPLIGRGGRNANLDVSYRRDGRLYYIESKFLEPYYSGNEHNREAYFDKEKYDVPEKDKDTWYRLFVDAQKYKLYNFSQLCRHLLAIWRKHNKDKQLQIVFQSVTWKMTECFINKIDDDELKESYRTRRAGIEEEMNLCSERVKDFLSKIGWNNLTFECLHYNDMLKDISSYPHLEEFKMRYFL